MIVSYDRLVGIFNTETVLMSEENDAYRGLITHGDKSMIVDAANNVVTSIVSSYTLIKRKILKGEYFWIRDDERV
jgi:hypothetical protein